MGPFLRPLCGPAKMNFDITNAEVSLTIICYFTTCYHFSRPQKTIKAQAGCSPKHSCILFGLVLSSTYLSVAKMSVEWSGYIAVCSLESSSLPLLKHILIWASKKLWDFLYHSGSSQSERLLGNSSLFHAKASPIASGRWSVRESLRMLGMELGFSLLQNYLYLVPPVA